MASTLRENALQKVSRLTSLLESRYDLKLDFSSAEHLHDVLRHYDGKRDVILHEHGEATALMRDDYAKAVLISETVRHFLREIAPKRRKRKNKEGA